MPVYAYAVAAAGWVIWFAPFFLTMLLVSFLIFIVGTEIRVRIEDRLLASCFGAEFDAYRRSVSAYIPFLKLSKASATIST